MIHGIPVCYIVTMAKNKNTQNTQKNQDDNAAFRLVVDAIAGQLNVTSKTVLSYATLARAGEPTPAGFRSIFNAMRRLTRRGR